jgi:hypothetical protein
MSEAAPAPVEKKRRRAWLLLALGLAVAAGALVAWLLHNRQPLHPDAELYTQKSDKPISLVDGWMSFAGVEEVGIRLNGDAHSWTQRHSARPPSTAYPPHVLDTLKVSDYSLLGVAGRLTLDFFNDRLFEITFEPDDAEACARALRKADPDLRRDRNGRVERIDGNWRLASNVDFAASTVGRALATQPYIIWQDLRLVRKRDDWDAQFGAIPYSAE